jgi:hypothetical protein
MRYVDVLADTLDAVMDATVPIGTIGDKPLGCTGRANLEHTVDFPQGFPRE